MNLKITGNKYQLYFKFMLILNVFSKVSKVMLVLARKDQDHILCSFSYKLVCVDNKFSKPIILCRVEHAFFKFTEAILEEYKYFKKVMKKHFNKNVIMTT